MNHFSKLIGLAIAGMIAFTCCKPEVKTEFPTNKKEIMDAFVEMRRFLIRVLLCMNHGFCHVINFVWNSRWSEKSAYKLASKKNAQ